jgi:hypothetical protein
VNDVADRIADENHIDARFIDDPRRRVIVRRQTDQLFAYSFAAQIAGR